MSIDEKYNVRPFVDPPESTAALNPIVLEAVDLALYDTDRQGLAKTLEKSITTNGFFNLVNFGISQEEIEYLRAISQLVLLLPEEIQQQYLASAARKEDEKPDGEGGERGQGYKPKGYWAIKNGVRDLIHHYNLRATYQDDFLEHPERHPELVAHHLKEIAHYYNALHRQVLPKLLVLCDIILQVPEGTIQRHYFPNLATNRDDSELHGRLMMYEPYGDDDASSKTEGVFLRGHSDISAFTFITSQPILALQIRDYNLGEWRYVNHRRHLLIVNIGDAMEFISGGYFHACLHRVIEPPEDQRRFNRLVIIYFCNPGAHAKLDPEQINLPKLKQLGYSKEDKLKQWDPIEFRDWNSAKGKLLGRTDAGVRNEILYFGRAIERWHHLINV